MKKRLEAELISIAHRILKLKNKSELTQLYTETQKLYETLSVLKFVEDNINIVQPKIDVQDVEEKLTIAFEKKPISSENEKNELNEIYLNLGDNTSIAETEIKLEADNLQLENETIVPEIKTELLAIPEEIKIGFEPLFEIADDKTEKATEKKKPRQIFEDLLGNHFNELTFEKVSNKKAEATEISVSESESEMETEIEIKSDAIIPVSEEVVSEPVEISKPGSLNENFSKTITFGLNDRIGFEKHLFAGSSEDMNRVISQLSTYNSFEEAEEFIEEMVKPDYNNWDGKEDYASRFMEVVARKFN